MSRRDAVLELRERVNEVHDWLSKLADGVQTAGGGGAHHLIDQVDRATVEAQGALVPLQAAVWRAVRGEAAGGDVLTPLMDAQRLLDQLRAKASRGLRDRALADHLGDLFRRFGKSESDAERKLGGWAGEAVPLIRATFGSLRAADAALAGCWREVAGEQGGQRATAMMSME